MGLVVTNILLGLTVQQVDAFSVGVVITHVNAMLVRTLPEFRNAIKQGLGSNSLTIKTEADVFGVFPFVQMLQDEEGLSLTFAYPITQTIQKLQRAMQRKQKGEQE